MPRMQQPHDVLEYEASRPDLVDCSRSFQQQVARVILASTHALDRVGLAWQTSCAFWRTGARSSRATTSTTRAGGNLRRRSRSWWTRCATEDEGWEMDETTISRSCRAMPQSTSDRLRMPMPRSWAHSVRSSWRFITTWTVCAPYQRATVRVFTSLSSCIDRVDATRWPENACRSRSRSPP